MIQIKSILFDLCICFVIFVGVSHAMDAPNKTGDDSGRPLKRAKINNDTTSEKRGGDEEKEPTHEQGEKTEAKRRPPPLPELHLAALKNDYLKLQNLLDNDVPVDFLDKVGNSALHIAAGAGSLKCMEILIDRGADVNLQNQNGLAPLHLAVRHNRLLCFDKLIEKSAKIGIANNDHITPIHLAAKYGRLYLLEKLIKLSAENEDDARKQFLNTSLMSGADAKKFYINIPDSWGQTPLHYSVIQKKIQCTQKLMEEGANISLKDATGMSSLLSATVSGSFECMLTLFENGAELVDSNKNGKNTIHLAVDSGSYQTVELVLTKVKEKLRDSSQFEQLLNGKDKTGMTPFVSAKTKEIADLLKEFGANESLLPEFNEVSCAICREMLHKSVTLACGHTFCRACIQAWRKINDTCPTCRSEVRVVGGYMHNWKIQKLLEYHFSDEVKKRENDNKGDPLECALDNVAALGKALGTEIVLDKNHTSILVIDNEFPLHLTYMPRKKKLCVYSPILAGLPKEDDKLLNIYNALLKYGNKGFGEGTSGIGVIVQKELIVLHLEIPMEYEPSDTLRRLSIPFVEMVKRWREIMKLLSESKPVPPELYDHLINDVKLTAAPPMSNNKLQENLNNLASLGYTVTPVLPPVASWVTTAIDSQSSTAPVTPSFRWTVNAIDAGVTRPVDVNYIVRTDVIDLSYKLLSNFTDVDGKLKETLLSGSVFGFKSGGGVFALKENEQGLFDLYLHLKVKLGRQEHDFKNDTLKNVFPAYLEQIREWKKILQP